MTNAELSIAFFTQMALILAVCRAVGWFNRRYFGQPQVVGEMIAGVLLGPSLFGLLLPQWQQFVFPRESLKTLYIGAQLGVGLFMFLVGIDFRSEMFRARARAAAAVSLAGMVVPFALATFLALWLMGIPGLFSDKATSFVAILFLGAAISITGFPVLARIIQERGIGGTPLGTLALSAGAIGDVAAWCMLAVVLASFGAGPATAVKAIAGGAAYAVVMLTVGRRLLARLGKSAERGGRLSHTMLGVVLALLMLCVSLTDYIGIHAVFGGFLLGLAMPRGLLTRELQQKLEPVVVVFLLPMFFTYSGLSTRLDVVSSGAFLSVAMVVLAASIVGKGVACWAAARLSGEDNRTALAIGSLMNARGLMELILVNIGLQKGVIQLPLFSIQVLMAIVTTLMASPLFEWFYGQHARHAGELEAAPLGE
jgi:Kef-type K+ transport system membrane component KefB